MRFEDALERAKDGDDAAIERLLAPFFPALTAFIRLRLHPGVSRRESPSDLLQSVCREVLVDLPTLRARDEAGFRSWLFSVARNKVRNKHAHHHADKRNVGRDLQGSVDRVVEDQALLATYHQTVTPSQDVAAREEIERIEAAFRQLPDDYHEVLLHVGIAGLTYAEAGRQMGRSEDSVRQLVHRARARLATLLD